MSYLQRLIDTVLPAPRVPALQPVLASTSPIFEQDQRLALPGFDPFLDPVETAPDGALNLAVPPDSDIPRPARPFQWGAPVGPIPERELPAWRGPLPARPAPPDVLLPESAPADSLSRTRPPPPATVPEPEAPAITPVRAEPVPAAPLVAPSAIPERATPEARGPMTKARPRIEFRPAARETPGQLQIVDRVVTRPLAPPRMVRAVPVASPSPPTARDHLPDQEPTAPPPGIEPTEAPAAPRIPAPIVAPAAPAAAPAPAEIARLEPRPRSEPPELMWPEPRPRAAAVASAGPTVTIGRVLVEVLPDEGGAAVAPRQPLTAESASVIGPLGQQALERRLYALRRW